MTISSTKIQQDVPAQVFKKFLEALLSAGASVELVTQLSKALLDDRTFTEIALKEAIFGEESVP